MTLPDKARREELKTWVGWPCSWQPTAEEVHALLDAADRLDGMEAERNEAWHDFAQANADADRFAAEAAAMRMWIAESIPLSSSGDDLALAERQSAVLSADAGRALLERVRRMEAALRLAHSAARLVDCGCERCDGDPEGHGYCLRDALAAIEEALP